MDQHCTKHFYIETSKSLSNNITCQLFNSHENKISPLYGDHILKIWWLPDILKIWWSPFSKSSDHLSQNHQIWWLPFSKSGDHLSQHLSITIIRFSQNLSSKWKIPSTVKLSANFLKTMITRFSQNLSIKRHFQSLSIIQYFKICHQNEISLPL